MKNFSYCVIGAGPAGIAAIGKLLDHGIDPKRIGWMDPHFAVGDLWQKWLEVSSNTKVDLFLKFLMDAKAFKYDITSKEFSINSISVQNTCLLKEVASPLQKITNNLTQQVVVFKKTAMALNLSNSLWEI